MFHHPKSVSSLAAALLLAGCGGGGKIGGTISGLSADGLTLSNGTETISVAANATRFSFPTELGNGVGYAVIVLTQPTGLRCKVSNGAGRVDTVDVPPVVLIDCVAVWPLSGTISGLVSSGLVLSNGGEDIAVEAGALSFAFPTTLATGAAYAVTVKTQPRSRTCTVSEGEGIVGSVPVSNVAVRCN